MSISKSGLWSVEVPGNLVLDVPFGIFNRNDEIVHVVDLGKEVESQGMGGFDGWESRSVSIGKKHRVGTESGQKQDRMSSPGQGRGGESWNKKKGRDANRYGYYGELWTEPKNTWTFVDRISFSRMHSCQYSCPEPTTLVECGCLRKYDRAMDRLNTKNERGLVPTEIGDDEVMLEDDEVIKEFVEKGVGNIFSTDDVLALIMAAPKTVAPWDLMIRKEQGKVFIGRRKDMNIHRYMVDETAMDSNGDDDVDSLRELAIEAEKVDRAFREQSLEDGSGDQSGGYRYRKWTLSENMDLVVRTRIDGVMDYQGKNMMMTIRTLNETDPRKHQTEWRKRLDVQRGSVLATEIRNNGAKLTRWAYESLLSGADVVKIGFVTRTLPKDRSRHSILGTTQYSPKDFAVQINVVPNQGYGILRTVVAQCLKLGDGRYALVRAPRRSALEIYSLPHESG